MKTTITISLEWWREDGKPVDPEHVEPLQAAGLEYAAARILDGYREGELTCGFADSTRAEYRGWWTTSSSVEKRETTPPAVRRALDHVSAYYPGVTHVAYDRNGRWMYFTDSHEVPMFGPEIDTGLLEDAADAVPALPATYYREV